MSSATAERREEILGELADWLHAGARDAQRRLLDAETAEDFERYTNSLCKLARGVRLSVTAQKKQEDARLAAEAKAAAEEAEARSEFVPRHIKRVRVRAAVGRHVWPELEDEGEVDVFWADMNARLDELECAPDFLERPVDELIAELCRDLGYDPPEPPPPPDPLIPAKVRTQAEPAEAQGAPSGHGPNGAGPPTADSS